MKTTIIVKNTHLFCLGVEVTATCVDVYGVLVVDDTANTREGRIHRALFLIESASLAIPIGQWAGV